MNEPRLARMRAILRANSAQLTRRRAWIYWTDLRGTAAIAWSALAGGCSALAHGALVVATLGFVVAVFAFYRASAFLHELAHMRDALPGFDFAWNLVVGVPLLTPSFVYRGVHTVHHARGVFATPSDPEYVEHDGGHVKLVAGFVLLPVALVVRWLVLAPASIFSATLRRRVIEKHSSLAGNPAFVRVAPTGSGRRHWHRLELACFVWSATLVGFFASRRIPLSCAIFVFALSVCVTAFHGLRSLTTHRFHGGGAPRTFEEQFLDSVNVTGNGFWSELGAPAGLGYHALHHFAPDLPYHALAAAHRLLVRELPASDAYHTVTFSSFHQVPSR